VVVDAAGDAVAAAALEAEVLDAVEIRDAGGQVQQSCWQDMS